MPDSSVIVPDRPTLPSPDLPASYASTPGTAPTSAPAPGAAPILETVPILEASPVQEVTLTPGTTPTLEVMPAPEAAAPAFVVTEHSLPELIAYLSGLGLPAFRARQVWHAVYHRSLTDLQDVHEWPQALRTRLRETVKLGSTTIAVQRTDKAAGTDKLVIKLHDGATVETVLMRYPEGSHGRTPRATVCVSSQAGCPLCCTFCATGLMGWARDLTAGEVVEQILHCARILEPEGLHVTNVVFMGMGEPMLVYDQVIAAIYRLSDPDAFGLGARHFTISTSGVIPGIERLTQEEKQVNLAISLHAPDDATRSQIVPLNKRYPIAQLMRAVRDYLAQTHRRVTFEYTMIRGVNDRPTQARQLASLLQGLLCHVNLIPLNVVPGIDLLPTPHAEIVAFRDILVESGIPVTIRDTRGSAIRAACGQLQTETRRQFIRPTRVSRSENGQE